MTHRRCPRSVARAARAAGLGLSLMAAPAAPAAAQTRETLHASAMRDPADAPPAGTAPDPRLAADEVVGIVLTALAHAGNGAEPQGAEDGRALALAYAFASPANRASIGTLERFADLVRDDAYRPLLAPRQVTRGAARVSGDKATQRVVVTGPDGGRVAYTFTMMRQTAGAFRGCWMTESVVREAPSRLLVPYAT